MRYLSAILPIKVNRKDPSRNETLGDILPTPTPPSPPVVYLPESSFDLTVFGSGRSKNGLQNQGYSGGPWKRIQMTDGRSRENGDSLDCRRFVLCFRLRRSSDAKYYFWKWTRSSVVEREIPVIRSIRVGFRAVCPLHFVVPVSGFQIEIEGAEIQNPFGVILQQEESFCDGHQHVVSKAREIPADTGKLVIR
ncbi:hypothetical protein P691DRAFT_787796 [Macrolepiota fuliginosa MF-IS2]|uniref:Uncharacterized protein n=1 Tax=Macrolepiota fuliginosa MF-IS2 TaxID=1400762 RepID=A0A9P5XI58_9AGAR|nr:hypothetical protein P691DRAFT_787796 [Macrolepiota fuliginosa MF-IS2]